MIGDMRIMALRAAFRNEMFRCRKCGGKKMGLISIAQYTDDRSGRYVVPRIVVCELCGEHRELKFDDDDVPELV